MSNNETLTHNPSHLLEVNHLKTYFKQHGSVVKAIDDVTFHVDEGEVLGIVGESGCGKSVTSLSIMKLLSEDALYHTDGKIIFDGESITDKTEKEMCSLRGSAISMIYQEPMTSLNPVFTCGDQIAEAICHHMNVSKEEAKGLAVKMLEAVSIPDAKQRALEFPHQLSGGMRQRVMIALALACNPKLLIADEPTTALDVTIQAQILDLLKKLQKERNMAIMLITHDLGVVADMAKRVIVMYAGRVVEEADVNSIFYEPAHPYTVGLLKSIPRIDENTERLDVIEGVVPNPRDRLPGCDFAPRCPYADDNCRCEKPEMRMVKDGHRVACWKAEQVYLERKKKTNSKINLQELDRSDSVLLTVKHLSTEFPVKKGWLGKPKAYLKAVNDVSFEVKRGEVLGIVGESGCGKTTLGKSILRLVKATSGEILFDGHNILELDHAQLQKVRRDIQVVFQDPYASLNPRMTVEQTITEPLQIHNIVPPEKQRQRAIELLETVGLAEYHLSRYPHEFSGGQRQRIGLARALALEPKLIICDEPTSALDVSIQSQVLNLMKDLQKQLGISFVFIAHGLATVKYISDRVAVMYLGKIVELADADLIYETPLHPYTKALMSAIPVPDPAAADNQRILLEGDVPSPVNLPSGCAFRTRCPYATEKCAEFSPELQNIGNGHFVACHYCKEIKS